MIMFNEILHVFHLSEDISEKEQDILLQQNPKWQTWLQIEKLRKSVHMLPWRPDLSKDETEEDCEDIDRMVLFDDVSPFLFDIAPDLHFTLITEFLTLFGLDGCRASSLDISHQFAYEDLYLFPQSLQKCCGIENSIQKSTILENFMSTLSRQLGDGLTKNQCTKFILMILDYKFSMHESEAKDSKLLKTIKSTCKAILKEPKNRENLDIWMKYAVLLWRHGQTQETIGVLEMAVSLLGPKLGRTIVKGYRALCELLLGFQEVNTPISLDRSSYGATSNQERVQHILQCYVDGEHHNVKRSVNLTSTVVLKTKKKLESLVLNSWEDLSVKDTMDEEVVTYFLELVKCQVLFEYSCNPGSLDSSVAIINHALTGVYKYADSHNISIADLEGDVCDKTVEMISKILFELFRYKIRLLHHHMMTKNYPLSHLRSTVDSALEMFPNNIYFLQVFLDIEKGSHILRRLDRYFSHSLTGVTTPVRIVYSLMAQLQRFEHISQCSGIHLHLLCPTLKKEGHIALHMSVGGSVGILNLVQLITQECFAQEASNLVGR